MKKLVVILILMFSLLVFSQIKIDHLEFLGEDFILNGEKVHGYWVYANKSGDTYIKVSAAGEGNICVDDVARAVVFYVELYEYTKDEKYLNIARKSAKFLVQMQDFDGDFYNFVYVDGTINKTGITSSKQHSWWAVRAFWALTKIAKYDSTFLSKALKAYKLLSKYVKNGLLNGVGDQTAVYILGLIGLYDLNINVEQDIRNSADAILKLYNHGFFSVYPEKISWHGWGNRYVEALVESYKVTKNELYLKIARKALEIEGPLFLSTGFIYSISDNVKLFPELSYAVESITVGAIKYYLLTKEEDIGILSALLAGWYKGLNRLGKPMYGPNGEGFDGMEFGHINYNAGAESTISALRTMLYLETLPEQLRKYSEEKIVNLYPILVLEAESGNWGISDVKIVVDGRYSGSSAISFSDNLRLKFKVTKSLYDVIVVGEGKYTCIISSSDGKLTEDLEGNYVYMGKINLESFRLTCKGEGIVDQVILIPEKFGISTSSITVLYKNGLIIKKETLKKPEIKKNKDYKVNYEINNNFLLFDLEPVFNNNGIGTPFEEKANFDNLGSVLGSYLSKDIVNKVKNYNIPFKISFKGNDNIRCNGQIITFDSVYIKNLYLLVSANHGDYEVNFKIGEKIYTVKVPDWCSNNLDITEDFRYLATGEKQFIKCGFKVIKLETNDEVEKIILPDEINVHLFAITGEF
ncbi:glycoside hydrolase family protein [Thermosipho atlanticus]|uniref:Uncharacterized protein n=1 Tax=Thermosipho atlanticus DSM 15807 TaxID=1123380 RepID=A0A1M5TNY9_9BACT|nr:hypothetical protein [Thermosipho atlanticus]SHH52487.1 hypothetical protein SAMN02745199_1432 [Thermosipho atlanticus DSM 15807]